MLASGSRETRNRVTCQIFPKDGTAPTKALLKKWTTHGGIYQSFASSAKMMVLIAEISKSPFNQMD